MEKKRKSEGKLKGWISKHKKLSIIIASAFLILCVAAIVVTVALSNKNSPDDSDQQPSYNPITKDANEVVYSRNLPGSKVLLTLKRGWYFTVEGDGINKSGKYSLNGNEITFDFVRDTDGTTKATIINENELSVFLPGATHASTFRKMVNYTVSFETNGGSTVNAVTVVNGDTVSEPTAPTKENSTFAGWYKDAGCTIAFRFNTDQITADTVLYAKWTDTSANTP